MNWHPTEDDLILHFYGESNLADEQRLDEHLSTCLACRSNWTELVDTLKLIDTATVPEPPAGFERVMWARIQPALPERSRRRVRWSLPQLTSAAAVAALVVIALVVAPRWFTGRKPVEPTDATPTAVVADATQARERVLLTAAGDHFEQAEMLLVELMDAPDTSRADRGFERQTASDLVASSRLYRETAHQNGDERLAQALEDLESVLVEVARRPDRLNRNDVDSLRARIEGDSLLFKVRAVGNEIRERQRHLSTVSEGAL